MVKKYVKIKGKSPALVEESEIDKILEKYLARDKKPVKKKQVESDK
jgi:hypothetical protein